MARRRRLRAGWWSRLSPTNRRWVKRIVGIIAGGFLLGYLLTAVLFFRGADRPPVVTVPDLREMDVRSAERLLRRDGLTLSVGDSLPNGDVRAGHVLTQSPLAGREVAPGSRVRVILSAGAVRRAVPVVAALTRDQATSLLRANGFEVQAREVPNVRAAGSVVGVEPSAGSVVRLPARVTLLVSAGPPIVAVPDVLGMREDAARAALDAAGLLVGDVDYVHLGPGAVEAVTFQDPAPGDSIPQGSRVRLRIDTDRLLGDPIR